ncbi:MAG: ABC transporter ATP-binding protein [Chloroflexi bacterium]|nr:ABC transporter ATP-binding protein [Chloroflexota bacterium]
MASPVIEAEKLTKSYGSFTAVDGLDLLVREGEVFGFLGPNGAGKTTSILMMLGLTEPTSGSIRVCGYDSTREPLKVKRIAGYLPENLGFYDDLTATENIRYVARLNGIPEAQSKESIPALLELVGIPQAAEQRVETFSKGMKQRLGIAAVLVKQPKLVFLDEPTSGLDPEGVKFVLDLITSLSRDQNITVLLSSHLLHQVQRICHRVGILSHGHLVAEGPLETLERETFGQGVLQVEVELASPQPDVAARVEHLEGVTRVEMAGPRLVITCDRDIRPDISRAVLAGGGSLVGMRMPGHGLEEIYLRFFGEAS